MKIERTKGGKPGQVKDLLRIADHPLVESIAIEGDRTFGGDTTLAVRIKDVPQEEQYAFTQALALVTEGYLRRRPAFEDAPAPQQLQREGRGSVFTKEEQRQLGDYLMNIGCGVDPDAPENQRTR
jgi:hypothetical protein